MKRVRSALVILYVLFILAKTLLFLTVCPKLLLRPVYPEPVFKGFFWEVQRGSWGDICLNILLFIPLGFLIGGKKGFIVGFLLSCAIEIIQYFGRIGYCEIDDLLNNTIGTGIGVLLNSTAGALMKRFRTKEDNDV